MNVRNAMDDVMPTESTLITTIANATLTSALVYKIAAARVHPGRSTMPAKTSTYGCGDSIPSIIAGAAPATRDQMINGLRDIGD